MPDPAKPEGTLSEHGPTRRPVLTIDYALYADHLSDSDLTDDQQKEVLDALWSIIVTFVDLGFAVEPAEELAAETCGQIQEGSDRPNHAVPTVIQSLEPPVTKPFALAAQRPAARKEES